MTRIASKLRASDGVTSTEAERFAADLRRLWPEGGQLGLAVSGGPDSLALLLLAHAAIPGRFSVATVNHGLRREAGDECAMVERECAARGIRCSTLQVKVGGGNMQASARDARYGALSEWMGRESLSALATAHHADDQAETLIMRLNRSSGLDGLAGVRPRGAVPGSRLPLLRPLLGWRRSELAEIVVRAGLQPALDPSNTDESYDRVRIRKALADAPWLDVAAVAASAAHLADAEEALEHYRQIILERHGFASLDVAGISEPRSLNREGQLWLVRWALSKFGGSARGSEIARLIDLLLVGKGGNLGGVQASVEGEDWVFRREAPRRV
jgi:tRNA(Ile)-lysidine synthase